ncbi:MAG: hypothetical protein J0H26_05530, partial [Alphaproteobacteria bacterium]|nr:hypothetical protein [Alphaproteobacteria bacterium]
MVQATVAAYGRLDCAFNNAGIAPHQVEASGQPMQIPVVDIVEIGAGGGSIAWCDPTGGIHVGPKSAGADPGP